MTKNEKLLKKYKNNFSFIFNDKSLSDCLKNHFDKNGSFVLFIIALLQNKIGDKVILNHLQINKDEWLELFLELYKNQEIVGVYKKLEMNPIIPFNQITESFSCFDRFVVHLIEFIKNHDLNLNIHESNLKSFFKSVFGYILYNCIDCTIPYDFKDILIDPDYDTKYIVVLNNTKLFAQAKQSITDNCNDKINDLIVLLLSLNKSLSKED